MSPEYFIVIFCCYNQALNKLSYINIEMENFQNLLPTNCQEDINHLLDIYKSECKAELIAYGEPVDVIEVLTIDGTTLFNETVEYENPICHQ